MSNPAANPDLYGRPRPKSIITNGLSSASSIALSTELARLTAESSKATRKRPSSASSGKTDDLFRKGPNRGVSKRAARDRLHENGDKKTTSEDIGYAEDAELQRARKIMEEKTRLYNAMKRGDYIPPN